MGTIPINYTDLDDLREALDRRDTFKLPDEDGNVIEFVPDDEVICRTPACRDTTDDGEGYDGYCGNCADRQYTATGGLT